MQAPPAPPAPPSPPCSLNPVSLCPVPNATYYSFFSKVRLCVRCMAVPSRRCHSWGSSCRPCRGASGLCRLLCSTCCAAASLLSVCCSGVSMLCAPGQQGTRLLWQGIAGCLAVSNGGCQSSCSLSRPTLCHQPCPALGLHRQCPAHSAQARSCLLASETIAAPHAPDVSVLTITGSVPAELHLPKKRPWHQSCSSG